VGNESEIRSPHGVGIALDLEAGVLSEHLAEARALDERSKPDGQSSSAVAVAGGWGLAYDQDAAHQLGRLAGFVELGQVFGGLQGRWCSTGSDSALLS
jgi:hypothetical protein